MLYVGTTYTSPDLSEAHAPSVLVHGLHAVDGRRGEEDHIGHELGGADATDGRR